ncbi:MAG: 50S ribosomal protein L24 [Candidatus Aminicenantales bacterium]|jgi:large subunit ribosomal protein L24
MGKIQLKKNDVVVVLKGKDKGKTGKLLKIFPETDRVIVERINFSKHFVKADRSKNVQGGVMEKEAPIHVSNVMLFCPECGQGVRVRTRRLEDGSKTRLCIKCEALIEKQK